MPAHRLVRDRDPGSRRIRPLVELNQHALQCVRHFAMEAVPTAYGFASHSTEAHIRAAGCNLGSKLYVGNLPFSSSEDDLRELFETHGSVESVAIIMDRDTGRPRGFAFVEMETNDSAQSAIRALDGTQFGGRSIRVNEAQDKRRGDSGGERRARW